MKKVAVIGAGNIGSRHLQGLARMKTEVEIEVVEMNRNNMVMSQDRYEQISHKRNVSYFETLGKLSDDIDLAIIATTAANRKTIFDYLIKKKKIKNFILEKVVFQDPMDFYDALDLLKENNGRAWVNCARRAWDIYKELKKEITKPFLLEAFGSDWGLCSNAIHILDLAAFLGGEGTFEISESNLDEEIKQSKRRGFKELTGQFTGQFECGSQVSINSYDDGDGPFIIQISWAQAKYTFFESMEKCFYSCEYDNWEEKEMEIKVPFQSEITNIYLDDILNNRPCNLTSLQESMDLHIPFLQLVQEHFKNHLGKEECHIT